MAEPALSAFGRYLKLLRQRRGLSLDDVEELTRDLPERVTKAYLSRCENGRQRIAVAKLTALSRVYHVPLDVLTERLDLDLQLERIGGPETGHLSFAQAFKQVKRAARVGFFWNAYAYARDAVERSTQDPLAAGFSSVEEQHAAALRAQGVMAALLGFARFALHELDAALHADTLTPLHYSLTAGALAYSHYETGNSRAALHYDTLALESAMSSSCNYALAHACYTHGCITMGLGDYGKALPALRTALRLYGQLGMPHCQVRSLLGLSGVYERRRNFDAGIRMGRAAVRVAERHRLRRFAALARCSLADTLLNAGRPRNALDLLSEGIRVADEFADLELGLNARTRMLRALGELGDPYAERFATDVLRFSARVPPSARALEAFRSFISEHYPQIWVAHAQHR